MAHRKEKSHDEELPFVALMDTMTNVVGVLIIVLVMIGISLANSVKKILSELPPVTVEQLQEALKKVVEVTPKEDPKKIEEEKKKIEEEMKKNDQELKTLDTAAEVQKIKLIDTDSLTKQIEDAKKARDMKKAELEKKLAEIDKLKALLDTTPVYQPPPATVVKLPNPRPVPEGAVMQRFLVANGRITYLNDEEMMKFVVAEIEKHSKELINSEVEVKDQFGNPVMETVRNKKVPKMKTIYDQKKIHDYFEKYKVPSRELKVELALAPNSPRMPLKLTVLPGAGEDEKQIQDPGSIFQRACRKFKSDGNAVMWFYVFKDSLATYLAARDVADKFQVPCGWEIYGNDYYQRTVQPYEVDYKPLPPKPPGPQPLVKIAAPKPGLD